MNVRNLAFNEWASATIVALWIGWTGSIFDLVALNIAAVVALVALMIERFVNQHRARNGGQR